MAGLRALVLASSALLVAAQITFPDSKKDGTTSSVPLTASPPAPPPASPPASPPAPPPASASPSSAAVSAKSPDSSSPSAAPSADAAPQTRFAGGPLGILGPLFGNTCDRCSTIDQHCCRTQGLCCSHQPVVPVGPPIQNFPGQFQGQFQGQFPGQFSGQFPGQFGGQFQNQFPGHVSPPGFHTGVKGGVCPVLGGIQHGVHRFSPGSAPCLTECQSDFQCPDIQKCCPVGCSTICRTPQGAPPVVQPVIKPGVCPGFGFGPFRSASNVRQADPGVDPSTSSRKEQRKQGRQRRSPLHEVDRTDRREIRLNRRFRVSGRAIRSAEDEPRRVSRQIPGGSRGQSSAQPSQRFFGLFCQSNCHNDFDCPGSHKCCAAERGCMQCFNPIFHGSTGFF